jgi:hypothetical protein
MQRTFIALLLVLSAGSARAQTPAPSENTDDQSVPAPSSGTIEKFLTRANRWFGADETGPTKSGFYPEFNHQITGSGWVSIGPGYHYRFLDGRALIEGSASVSWRGYEMAQGRFELSDLADHHLTVGSQVLWQDMKQIDYFGVGSGSTQGSRSEYRMRDTDVIGYSAYRPIRWLAVEGTFGWLSQPTLAAPSGAFLRGYPSALDAFSSDPGIDRQPNFLHGGVSVAADTRDHQDYARHGGVYRAAATVYSDRDYAQYSFRRYELEGLQYVPVVPNRLTLAFHGWSVFSDTSNGNSVPFYLTPALGGNDTLRGYIDYRFHDRNLLLASGEARVHVHRFIDVAGFFDAGNVAARAGDLDLNKTSWGGGVRLHTATTTLGRFDIGHSTEGWQYVFRLNDPFRLARLVRRTAATPFVP